MVNQTSSQEYIVDKAEITSEKLNQPIDVSSMIGEIKIFESLDKPYLTGTIGILDDAGLFQTGLSFKGTETLTLGLSTFIDGQKYAPFEHAFTMTSIERKERISDKAEVYVISLMDVHAFVDSTKKISRSFKGKIETIISNVIIGEMKKEVDLSYVTTSIQPEIRIVTPYLSPIEIVNWLVKRATTENGSPYWVHASMFDERLRISSFDGLYTKEPFNLKLPYLYAAASTQGSAALSYTAQSQMIKNIDFHNMENIMRMINVGAIGSELSSTDVFKNRTLVSHHRASETLDKLTSAEIIPSDSKQNVYDEQYRIEEFGVEGTLDNQRARIMHSLTSEGTYYGINNYHDAFSSAQVGDKLRNNAIRRLLEKNTITITVTGIAIFLRQVSVGDTIFVKIYNSDTNNESMVDMQRSGIYLIRNAVHVFADRLHNVTMTITKLNTIRDVLQ